MTFHLQATSHYLFDAQFCNPASGWEKGQIEKNVQDSRRRIWQRLPHFSSLEALNDWLADECVRLWQQIRHPACDQSIWQIWSEERPFLMPVGQPFDGFVEHTKRVSPTCLIAFERDRYSVPASYANLPVSLRVYADRLVVVAEGHVIAQHPRHINRRHDRGATFYDWRHYLAVLRKPGALRNGAPFTALPEAFRQLQALLLPHAGGDREMVEILSLVLLHDEQLVLAAVTLALEAGTPSKQTILNILSRLLDGTPLPPLTAPQALSLTVEPEANVGRYDTLRTQEPRHAA
ncbi:Transposase and inactivated derivatives [Achromobacter dolens]|nr:Transposase and inactivated derivatives [Achromobacter dolens]